MEIQDLNHYLIKDENIHSITQFIYSCISEICCNTGPTYNEFLTIGWNHEEFNYLHKVLLTLLKNPVVLQGDDAKMPQEFFLMPEKVQTIIVKCLKVRGDQLSKSLAFIHSQKQLPTMIDFDWRLKMIMGSSKVSSLKEPVVQLDLRVKDKEGEKILDIEMNRDELDCFIRFLENANNSLA